MHSRSVFPNSPRRRWNNRLRFGQRIVFPILASLLVVTTPAFSQILHFGAKAGVPVTDYFDTNTGIRHRFASSTNRYTVGPEIELTLPHGFAFEVDALYKRFHFTGSTTAVDVITNEKTTANSWEFPLLVKYKVSDSRIRPFVDAGVSFHHIADIKQITTSRVVPFGNAFTTSTSNPTELDHQNDAGFVMGGGIEFKLPLIHVSPELRYTRWGNENFRSFSGLLSSKQNQLEFLVGFTF
jgi:opacity protein-like surface antigen